MAAASDSGDSKRSRFGEWFRHAFAIDDYGEDSLEEPEKAILDRLAHQIHAKDMTAAAILWIHSNRHFNYLGSQAVVAAKPVLDISQPVHFLFEPLLRRFGIYIPLEELPLLASAFEKRYSIEYLLQRLEGEAAGDYNTPTAAPENEGGDG